MEIIDPLYQSNSTSDGLPSYFKCCATSKQGDRQKPLKPLTINQPVQVYQVIQASSAHGCVHQLTAGTPQRLAFRLAAAQKPMNNFFLTCKNRSVYIFKLH